MNILQHDYPDDIHIFVLDNAPSYLKQGDNALSVQHLSKAPTLPRNPWFGVPVPDKTEDGKLQYNPDGTVLKKKAALVGAKLLDGTPQSLYFKPGHPREGIFKGMVQILMERGIDVSHLKAECPTGFPKRQDSLMEQHCENRGFKVIYLPRFHCELNPIEQCWGYAKRVYREYPRSKTYPDLEQNVLRALESIPLEIIRK
ncbi:hypothetical protein PsYK624_170390 [Phanerochaete sordida]|uniref:Tc1-like transposase DDE domain-containing protein n=1 Tax=Phanerochaete sordida TaxID=48140 RepID=A0A9P3LME0_9APHY|nr:hypothetical protein PsYK624_170390 [Phanerochaete sordida]